MKLYQYQNPQNQMQRPQMNNRGTGDKGGQMMQMNKGEQSYNVPAPRSLMGGNNRFMRDAYSKLFNFPSNNEQERSPMPFSMGPYSYLRGGK